MDIVGVAAAIIAYLQLLEDKDRFDVEQRQTARLALSEAFHATESYYAILTAGQNKDISQEHHISDLWERAAIAIEPFSATLASRLGLKSRYWSEGAAWSDEQVALAKIQLRSVRRDANFSLIRRNLSQ
jgi:hypothetical protein